MSGKQFSDETVQYVMRVFKAGLNRFYSDGDFAYKKETIFKMFKEDVDLEDPRVQKVLKEWEAAGYIRLNKTEDRYLTVLKFLPD